MPELPEVEVVRRDLATELAGTRIIDVVATGRRSVRRYDDPQHFVDALVGRTVTDVTRRAKHIVVHLDDGAVLVVHLRMSGQLLWVDPATPAPKHTHVVITTDAPGTLRFVDPRTFGEMFVSRPDPETGVVPELAHFGAEPLDSAMTLDAFAALLAGRRARIKSLLMDQRVIVGIGNIYSDEMLFAAGLRWDRAAESLTPGEVARLYAAMRAILEAAIAGRGSSLADAQYVDLYGQLGGFGPAHQVHARAGEPCPRCGTEIVRERALGRSTAYCPACQG